MNKRNKKFVITSMPGAGISRLTSALRNLGDFNVYENNKDLIKLENLIDVSNCLNEMLSNNKYDGFKLFHKHLSKTPLVKDYINNNDIYVIHLYRENVIKQIILEDVKVSPKIDMTKIPSKINKINKANKELTKYFKGKRYLKISYEELTDKNRGMMHVGKIYNLLRINKNPIIDVPLSKHGYPSTKVIVSNYGEVIREMRRCKMVKKEWFKGL